MKWLREAGFWLLVALSLAYLVFAVWAQVAL